jgi:hypothetical protein
VQSLTGLGKRGFVEKMPDGKALPEALKAILDAPTLRLTPAEFQRQCDYALKGLILAVPRCLSYVRDPKNDTLTPKRKAELVHFLEAQHAMSVLEPDEKKAIAAHHSSAHYVFSEGDLNRALMWESGAAMLGNDASIASSLLLYLQGADKRALWEEDFTVLVQGMLKADSKSAPWEKMLATAYLSGDLSKAQAKFDADCAKDDYDACALLALRQLPALVQKAAQRSAAESGAIKLDALEVTDWLASSDEKRDAIRSEINKIESAAVRAQGQGIRVTVTRHQGDKISDFGVDSLKLEPTFLIETRSDRTSIARSDRSCSKVKTHWECQDEKVSFTATGIDLANGHFLHANTRSALCDGKPCKRIEVHSLYANDLSKHQSAGNYHKNLVGQYIWIDEQTNLPIRTMLIRPEWHLYYAMEYDVAMAFTTLPEKCESQASQSERKIESITIKSAEESGGKADDLKVLKIPASEMKKGESIADLIKRVGEGSEAFVVDDDQGADKRKAICRY